MNIEETKKEILRKFPILGDFITELNFIADNKVPTIATNNKDIYYNIDFMNSITEEQREFAIVNVLLHVRFNHISRVEGKDSLLWNVATDAVINDFLTQEGLVAIDGAINLPGASAYEAEDLYNKLKEAKDKKALPEEKRNGEKYAQLIQEFYQEFLTNNEQSKNIK